MVERERLDDFRTRFGLGNDPEAFGRFRTRVVQAARTGLNLLLADERADLEGQFAFRNGSRYVQATSWGAGGHSPHGAIEELEQVDTYLQLLERTQHLLWTFEEFGYFESKVRYGDHEGAGLLFAVKLAEAIDLSPGIDLRLQLDPGRADLLPAGVPLLDHCVDQSMQWLARFPDADREFRQALAILAQKQDDQFRQAQDSVRFALEKVLKLLLGNSSSLEDQGKPLKEWLRSKGLHQALSDVAVKIIMLLSKQYQNSAVKHDNAVGTGEAKVWQAFEVEYIIYQYATLFRLLSEASAMKA